MDETWCTYRFNLLKESQKTEKVFCTYSLTLFGKVQALTISSIRKRWFVRSRDSRNTSRRRLEIPNRLSRCKRRHSRDSGTNVLKGPERKHKQVYESPYEPPKTSFCSHPVDLFFFFLSNDEDNLLSSRSSRTTTRS